MVIYQGPAVLSGHIGYTFMSTHCVAYFDVDRAFVIGLQASLLDLLGNFGMH